MVPDDRTHPHEWRLRNVRGRQTWHHLETKDEQAAWPQTTADKYHLGMDTVGRCYSAIREVSQHQSVTFTASCHLVLAMDGSKDYDSS